MVHLVFFLLPRPSAPSAGKDTTVGCDRVGARERRESSTEPLPALAASLLLADPVTAAKEASVTAYAKEGEPEGSVCGSVCILDTR